jgi:fructose-1,6-bisphosphatase/inositol monophosphatase family enzyme
MELHSRDLDTLHNLAIEAARTAGNLIQSKVGEHRETNTKEGGNTLASQVVTEVDLESEHLILETLRPATERYDLGVLTEEQEDDSSRLTKDYFWCIDPIDGTLPFIESRPGYSVVIALVARDGTPVIGVILDPASDTLFHASTGSGAMKSGVLLPPAAALPDRPLSWMMDRSMKSIENYRGLVEEMEIFAARSGYPGLEIIDHAGAALNASWVTESHPAVYFKFPKKENGGGSLWDFAASACLIREWETSQTGHSPSDIFGNPLRLNPEGSTFMNEGGVLYASSPELAQAVTELYFRFSGGRPTVR